VSFLGLLARNLWTRKIRTLLTGFAVAIGVMTVVTLGVVTHSLANTAAGVLHAGNADFAVAQSGVSDLLTSTVSQRQVDGLNRYPQVKSAVGALVAAVDYDASHPLFLELGVPADQLSPFGVEVLRGRPFAPAAVDEVMLGWRAADDLGKNVGDRINLDGDDYTVTGVYRIGQSTGDSAAMLPLSTLQARQKVAGTVTLAFVDVKPGTTKKEIAALRARIEHDHPNLATVKSPTEFGRVDRSLQLLSAADRGATILAVVIGAILVANTMMLSFFERTREFGVMRAVGWGRGRIMFLVIAETLVITFFGAALGVGLSFLVTAGLQHVSSLVGYLDPQYDAQVFARAFWTAAGIGFLGAVYPSARAALLSPLEALRHE
jgi:putative ABC transport system permease protein